MDDREKVSQTTENKGKSKSFGKTNTATIKETVQASIQSSMLNPTNRKPSPF